MNWRCTGSEPRPRDTGQPSNLGTCLVNAGASSDARLREEVKLGEVLLERPVKPFGQVSGTSDASKTQSGLIRSWLSLRHSLLVFWSECVANLR